MVVVVVMIMVQRTQKVFVRVCIWFVGSCTPCVSTYLTLRRSLNGNNTTQPEWNASNRHYIPTPGRHLILENNHARLLRGGRGTDDTLRVTSGLGSAFSVDILTSRSSSVVRVMVLFRIDQLPRSSSHKFCPAHDPSRHTLAPALVPSSSPPPPRSQSRGQLYLFEQAVFFRYRKMMFTLCFFLGFAAVSWFAGFRYRAFMHQCGFFYDIPRLNNVIQGLEMPTEVMCRFHDNSTNFTVGNNTNLTTVLQQFSITVGSVWR